jgi:hypothetical protein
LPPAPAPKLRFIGLFGSQLGGSNPAPLASAFVPSGGELDVEPDDEELEDEEVVEKEVEDIGGGLADKVTFVPSSKRSKAC